MSPAGAQCNSPGRSEAEPWVRQGCSESKPRRGDIHVRSRVRLKPEIVRRNLSHPNLWPSEEAGRAPPVPSQPRELHYEALEGDLPWEEPSYDAEGAPEDESIVETG